MIDQIDNTAIYYTIVGSVQRTHSLYNDVIHQSSQCYILVSRLSPLLHFSQIMVQNDGRKHSVPVVDKVDHYLPWNTELDLNEYYTDIDRKYY